MTNIVRHNKRYYKQMALEVAVRNPERYEGILKTFSRFEGNTLDDITILDIYSQLYLDGAITSDKLANTELSLPFLQKWIPQNNTHNNEWGFPTGYQAAFTRYLKTLSEFGFIYAQYGQPLRLSPIAKSLLAGKITLSEAFAVQSMRFWRKSPYRRVLNDFNFFEFIVGTLLKLSEKGHRMTYCQFLVALFSDDGNVDEYVDFITKNKIGTDYDKAYKIVCNKYSQVDDNHSKVAKQQTAFRDYGNTVFRVLQLTGFINVKYDGIMLLSPNKERIKLYEELKAANFTITETAKESEEAYFEQLGSFPVSLENILRSHREERDTSTIEYTAKIRNIIASYSLTKEIVEDSLLKVSGGVKNNKDIFWFIQDPVKFEFLLTLYAYFYFGDTFDYKPNFICDEEGIPYSHAPGNIGDIEIFNKHVYWLIEATLIRGKIQQINNETVNLFRHIDATKTANKYLTLVAPYIHDDTKLIFNVASVITALQKNKLNLFAEPQTTTCFINEIKADTADYFKNMENKAKDFINSLRTKLNNMAT